MGAADVLLSGQVVAATNKALVVALNGAASSALPTSSTPTVSTLSATTRVATNVAAVTLKAANVNRRGLTAFNNSAANLFLKLGATPDIGAGTESYTVKLVPGSYYEVPYNWSGVVSGIWDAADANGEALITELT